MRVGILGAGNVGGALARVWARKGHEVIFGAPDTHSERTRKAMAALGGAGRAGTNAEAGAFGEVLVLSVPWPAARQAIESSGNLAGKVLIDCTNPLAADLQNHLGARCTLLPLLCSRFKDAAEFSWGLPAVGTALCGMPRTARLPLRSANSSVGSPGE